MPLYDASPGVNEPAGNVNIAMLIHVKIYHFVLLPPPYFLQMPSRKRGNQARLSAGEVLDAALSLTQNVVQVIPEPFKSVCCGAVSLVASIRTVTQQVSIQSPSLLDINMTVLHSLGKDQ